MKILVTETKELMKCQDKGVTEMFYSCYVVFVECIFFIEKYCAYVPNVPLLHFVNQEENIIPVMYMPLRFCICPRLIKLFWRLRGISLWVWQWEGFTSYPAVLSRVPNIQDRYLSCSICRKMTFLFHMEKIPLAHNMFMKHSITIKYTIIEAQFF